MKCLIDLVLSNSLQAKDVGLLIIRLGLGCLFLRHGLPKILNGTQEWLWLGSKMSNMGINIFPLFWGLCAALTEFFGGISLIFGLGTRIACFFMSFVMFVALIHHLKKGDSFGYYSHPFALMFVFIGLMIAGAGKYSLDNYLL